MKNNICENCDGKINNTCCCELTNKIRQALALFCPACDGKDVEHNHYVTGIKYDYESNDCIEITNLDIVFEPVTNIKGMEIE